MAATWLLLQCVCKRGGGGTVTVPMGYGHVTYRYTHVKPIHSPDENKGEGHQTKFSSFLFN